MKVALVRCIALVFIIGLFATIVSVNISYKLPSVEKINSHYEELVAANGHGSSASLHIHSNILSDDDEIDLRNFLDLLDAKMLTSPQSNEKVSNTLLAEKLQVEDMKKPGPHIFTKKKVGYPANLQERGQNNPSESPQKHSSSEHFRSPEVKNLQSVKGIENLPPNLNSKVTQQTKTIANLHQIPRSSLLTENSEPSTKGYILAVNYYEQQSMGSRNLFQLQCWAQHLGLAVVKPVMKDSFLLTPLDERQQQSLLKFEDSFDLQEWTRQTTASNFAPLVEWSDFLSKAPRNVILVQYNYPSVSVLKRRQKAGEPVMQSHVGDRYKSGCSPKWPTSSQQAYLKSNNFHVVRSVCFNFYLGDQVTLDEFNAHLLGEHGVENVTIIMDLWRGLGTGQRVLIKDTCSSMFPINENIKLSNRLISDASRYVETYLESLPFIAIMARLEMTLLTVHKKEPVLPFCLREIISELDAFKKDTGLNSTFLSIDIGRYGSKKWRTNVDPDLKRDFGTFVQNVYGLSSSVSSWERTFEEIATTRSRDAGYIGLLQKAIVTQAKCILFVGGGAFQRHALYLYRQLHPRKDDQCLRVVPSCTSSTKFRL